MQEAVDALLQLDERTVVGQIAHRASDHGPWRITASHHVPWVHRGLLHAKADLLLLGIHLQHNNLDLISNRDNFTRVIDTLGPRHLGDVNQTLDTVLKLDESSVGHQVDNLASHTSTDRELVASLLPRRFRLLLHAQRNALTLSVDLQDLDLNLIVDRDQFGRMVDPTPGHVSDMQEAIDPTKINKHAKVSDILDDPGTNLPLIDLAEER